MEYQKLRERASKGEHRFVGPRPADGYSKSERLPATVSAVRRIADETAGLATLLPGAVVTAQMSSIDLPAPAIL